MGGLTVTRKENERVFIGNDIIVTVDRPVRLTIDAPREISIQREEIRGGKGKSSAGGDTGRGCKATGQGKHADD